MQARQKMCEQCLKETIQAGMLLATSPPLLAFLDVPPQLKGHFQAAGVPE